MTDMMRGELRPDDREPGTSDIEREFGRLAPAAIPPGLRGQILTRAAEASREVALRPWMRVAAVAGSVSIVALLVLDPLQSRHEKTRLNALLDGRSAVASRPDTAPELAEAGLGAGTEAERLARLQALAAAEIRKPRERDPLGTLERLKGRWEYETAQDLD